jgi:hypothetical protein
MSVFMHSAVSFGTPEMPPPGLGSTIGPISLHNAIVFLQTQVFGEGFLPNFESVTQGGPKLEPSLASGTR